MWNVEICGMLNVVECLLNLVEYRLDVAGCVGVG